MSTKATRQAQAAIVRQKHVKVGGDLTTAELSRRFGVSSRSILNWLHNLTLCDPEYVGPRSVSQLTAKAVTHLQEVCGFSIEDIAAAYNATPETIRNILAREEVTI